MPIPALSQIKVHQVTKEKNVKTSCQHLRMWLSWAICAIPSRAESQGLPLDPFQTEMNGGLGRISVLLRALLSSAAVVLFNEELCFFELYMLTVHAHFPNYFWKMHTIHFFLNA